MPDSDPAIVTYLLDKAEALRTLAAQHPAEQLAAKVLDVAEQFEEKAEQLRSRLRH